jgi:hypothetical protein
MSYFKLYEKTKELRKQVKIGSLWRVTKSTAYDSGLGFAYNMMGTPVKVIGIDSQHVRYIISRDGLTYQVGYTIEGYDFNGFIRPIDIFLETFAQI